jgi:hypothetical protein
MPQIVKCSVNTTTVSSQESNKTAVRYLEVGLTSPGKKVILGLEWNIGRKIDNRYLGQTIYEDSIILEKSLQLGQR